MQRPPRRCVQLQPAPPLIETCLPNLLSRRSAAAAAATFDIWRCCARSSGFIKSHMSSCCGCWTAMLWDAECFAQEAEAAAEVAAAAGGATAKAAAAAGVATTAAEPAAGSTAEAAEADSDASDDAVAGHADASGSADGAMANGAAGGPSAAGGTAASATAANGAAANGTKVAASGAAASSSDAAVLAAEFDGFDEGLIASMLEDQGGDVKEVRFYLQVCFADSSMH